MIKLLALGEIVCMRLIDSDGYIKKESNNVLIITQPKFGKSTTMKSKFKNLDKVFDGLKECNLYVNKSGELITRENNILDKFFDVFKKE